MRLFERLPDGKSVFQPFGNASEDYLYLVPDNARLKRRIATIWIAACLGWPIIVALLMLVSWQLFYSQRITGWSGAFGLAGGLIGLGCLAPKLAKWHGLERKIPIEKTTE